MWGGVMIYRMPGAENPMKPILAYVLIASFAVAGLSLRSLADDSNSTRPVVTQIK